MAVVIESHGFDAVIAVLDKLENPQWDQLIRIIGMTVEEQTVNHFTEQGGPEGAWQPRRDNNPWPILVDTGTLKRSITNVPGDMQVTIGSRDVDYAIFHQEGTQYMPRRAFLGLSASDTTELQGKIEDFIAGVIGG